MHLHGGRHSPTGYTRIQPKIDPRNGKWKGYKQHGCSDPRHPPCILGRRGHGAFPEGPARDPAPRLASIAAILFKGHAKRCWLGAAVLHARLWGLGVLGFYKIHIYLRDGFSPSILMLLLLCPEPDFAKWRS